MRRLGCRARDYPHADGAEDEGLPSYGDVVGDVLGLLRERSELARELGVEEDRLLLDPGIDLAKTPAESVELLRRLPELDALGRPLLLAISARTSWAR